MWRGFHDDQSQRVIGPVFDAFVFAQAYDGIEDDACLDVFRRQFAIFLDFVTAVVAQTADIAAFGGYNRVEQREFRIAAVRHVATALVERPLQYGSFVGLAACVAFGQINANRHARAANRTAYAVAISLSPWLHVNRQAPLAPSTGNPFNSVPSTSVTTCCKSFNRGSEAIG